MAAVTLSAAMAAAGTDPGGLSGATDWLGRLRGLLELHIDQSLDVAEHRVAAAVVQALAARMRVQVELRGVADHAGTTRRILRSDALLAAARLIVLADDLAGPEMVTTAGRILVEPNAPTTVPAHVRLWLDARAPGPDELDRWWEDMRAAARELEETARVEAKRWPPSTAARRSTRGAQRADRGRGAGGASGARADLLRGA